ncbi:winged helix-turn-helix transcriptional regulator [Chitinophaga varians]|uniref:Winged helix-turn-helix transcriptional regulator n=1 Tax=Chitinophaga varians TaxID=2202339 RepID=A0A847RX64_9BACT|nr:metalloregulator ArsR/SmtB family transcription factor [Chitinophaga varians]NLR66544.1 winged helix-turn-helix transcriptional regulator [Chitinophaga varians]
METRRDVFHAIADPTRRAILHMLAGKKMNLNAVADRFDISRPAISRHIKVLTECGMVIIKQEGRERYCIANPQPLKEVEAWMKTYKDFWADSLDALDEFLKKQRTRKK